MQRFKVSYYDFPYSIWVLTHFRRKRIVFSYSVLVSGYVLVMDVIMLIVQVLCRSVVVNIWLSLDMLQQILQLVSYVLPNIVSIETIVSLKIGRRMLLTWCQTPTWKVAKLNATSPILISDMPGYVFTLCVDTRISLMTSSARISLKLFKEAAKRPLYITPST